MDCEGTARLLLLIDGHSYVVTCLRPDPAVAAAAWRLTRLGGRGERASHDVSVFKHGVECTCGDWVFHAHKRPQGCKHVKAARAVGLIPEL